MPKNCPTSMQSKFRCKRYNQKTALPERKTYLTDSVGNLNASNFEELSILIRQNVDEILAD